MKLHRELVKGFLVMHLVVTECQLSVHGIYADLSKIPCPLINPNEHIRSKVRRLADLVAMMTLLGSGMSGLSPVLLV